MFSRKLLLSLVLFWTLAAAAQGLIWSAGNWAANGVGGGGTPYSSWQIAFDHVLNPHNYWDPWTPPSQNAATRIFCMTLTTNDSGRTFVANATNEPGFAGFVAGLTDGANNYIRFQTPDISSCLSQSEQGFLGRTSLAPDLAGYNITEIHFRVNNFYDWYDPSDAIYGKHLDYFLDFYGTPVPEPSTWALLGLGAAALLIWSKARKQQTTPRG